MLTLIPTPFLIILTFIHIPMLPAHPLPKNAPCAVAR